MKPRGKHYVTIERSNANFRRRKKAAAQARLNRAAVAFAAASKKGVTVTFAVDGLKWWDANNALMRAVRAFQKASAK